MPLAEVLEDIKRLTPGEREELLQFMRSQRLMESADYRERVTQAHSEIDAGAYVTLDQLKELIARNQAARRAS